MHYWCLRISYDLPFYSNINQSKFEIDYVTVNTVSFFFSHIDWIWEYQLLWCGPFKENSYIDCGDGSEVDFSPQIFSFSDPLHLHPSNYVGKVDHFLQRGASSVVVYKNLNVPLITWSWLIRTYLSRSGRFCSWYNPRLKSKLLNKFEALCLLIFFCFSYMVDFPFFTQIW